MNELAEQDFQNLFQQCKIRMERSRNKGGECINMGSKQMCVNLK